MPCTNQLPYMEGQNRRQNLWEGAGTCWWAPSHCLSLLEMHWELAFSVRVTDSHLFLIFPSGASQVGLKEVWAERPVHPGAAKTISLRHSGPRGFFSRPSSGPAVFLFLASFSSPLPASSNDILDLLIWAKGNKEKLGSALQRGRLGMK